VPNLHGVKVSTETANSQLKRTSFSLLRRFTNPASQRFIGYADEMPSASSNPFFQPTRATWPDDVPAVNQLASLQGEARGQFSLSA
jgi:hypothetical protein